MPKEHSPEKHYACKDEPIPHNTDDIQHLEHGEATPPDFTKIQSTGSIMISPELFEKLYLNPKTPVAGNLRSIIGNPTPL